MFPYFQHVFSTPSFDDYLRKFSFLPSGKWIRDLDHLKLTRVPFAVEPERLVKEYTKHCVTYNAPIKTEDGIQRVIYQMSPTLHFEAAFWVWIEHKIVQSYASLFVCYHNEDEYTDFIDAMYDLRREGNTEDKPTHPGFFIGDQPVTVESLTKKKAGLDNSAE